MQNALLIGLSRQTILERQLDVVSNNIANVNTTGFKADSSLFEEYLMSGAHEDNFVGSDRRVSYVQDRGTFRDFSQGAPEQTKNPLDIAIDGGGFLVVQTPAGERYTRDGGLAINNQGQLVTASGQPVTLVAVAAILVASIRLHCLDAVLNREHRGPNLLACDAQFRKGAELGWFEHGSTIIVFAPGTFSLCDNVREGATIRVGEPLMRLG